MVGMRIVRMAMVKGMLVAVGWVVAMLMAMGLGSSSTGTVAIGSGFWLEGLNRFGDDHAQLL